MNIGYIRNNPQRLGYLIDEQFAGKRCHGNKNCIIFPSPISMMSNTLASIISWPKNTPSHSISITSGGKRYELSDWLGNVRVVINDRKTAVNSGSITLSYIPQIINVTDYYSFGFEISERTYSLKRYRFSFNGKEDISEQRWYQDYGARMYHRALGRFISADPLIVGQKKYAYYSPYHFAGNKPIIAVDLDGLEPKSVVKVIKDEKKGTYTYKFTKLAAALLSYVSGTPIEIIENTEIMNRSDAVLLKIPLYSAEKGGGAITFDEQIFYTENFFKGWKEGHSKNYGGDTKVAIYKWLRLSAHEVVHLAQAKKYKSGITYLADFLWQYIRYGGHDKAPGEMKADQGRDKFERFHNFVNEKYGEYALEKMFLDEKMTEEKKLETLENWKNEFESQNLPSNNSQGQELQATPTYNVTPENKE